MIELQGVTKRYGDAVALHPTDLTIPAGQTTALIGPSGCGKSTLLRLLMGLLEPTGGAVHFDGTPVNAQTAQELRRRMGYVIQDGGLFPHLTAAENVMLMAKHLRRSPDTMQKRLTELCALTRFPQEGLTRYPVELSGGQRQRVSLMRALMLEPEVLLLDEPLGALDPLVRAGLQTDLKQIFATLKQTVVLVTHDMAEAGYLGDSIVLLSEGAIVQRGTLDDLRDRPAAPFVTQFLNAQRSLVQL
ncbi:MAG: opuCA [Chthonomonadaceae bacterium]|nr:opuCA [Chthonomonadaceae bacterium]